MRKGSYKRVRIIKGEMGRVMKKKGSREVLGMTGFKG